MQADHAPKLTICVITFGFLLEAWLLSYQKRKMAEEIFGMITLTSKGVEEGTAILQPKRSPYIHSEPDLLARACIIKIRRKRKFNKFLKQLKVF